MILSTEAVSSEYLHLNSCGIQNLGDRDYHRLRPKGRVDYHLLYIVRGCCYVEEDGADRAAPAGSLILYLPHETQHYAFLGADQSISCYLHFSGVGCEALLRRIGLWGQRVFWLGQSRAMESIFEQLATEYTLKRPFADGMLSRLLWQLFAVIGRTMHELQDPLCLKNRSRIDQVCLLMHEEYAQNQPLTRYAAYCSLSLSRFSHVFRAATGLTPLNYLNRIRIDKAKELLLNTSLSVAEISEITGFSSQNYFSRLFKKQVGQSPTQFLRSH